MEGRFEMNGCRSSGEPSVLLANVVRARAALRVVRAGGVRYVCANTAETFIEALGTHNFDVAVVGPSADPARQGDWVAALVLRSGAWIVTLCPGGHEAAARPMLADVCLHGDIERSAAPALLRELLEQAPPRRERRPPPVFGPGT